MFAKNLKQIRLQSNLTQKSVADFLHISPQSISKWENGESTPSIDFLPTLAQLFDCSIDDFFKEKHTESKVDDIQMFLSFLKYFEGEEVTEKAEDPIEFMAKNYGWQDNCKSFYTDLAKEKFISLQKLQSIAGCDLDEVESFVLLLEENNVLTKVPDSKLYVVNQESVDCSFSMIKVSRLFEALGQGKSIEEAIEAIPETPKMV